MRRMLSYRTCPEQKLRRGTGALPDDVGRVWNRSWDLRLVGWAEIRPACCGLKK